MIPAETPRTDFETNSQKWSLQPRWRWMATAAASSAGIGSASAEIVQITQIDNFASFPPTAILVDSLDGDITKDGMIDLPNLRALAETTSNSNGTGTNYLSNSIRVGSIIGGFTNTASTLQFFASGFDSYSTIGGTNAKFSPMFRAKVGGEESIGTVAQTKIGLIPVSFKDTRINSNLKTNGLLEVRATNNGHRDHRIDLIRLIFDDASTAEPTGVMAGDPTYPEFVESTPNNPPANASAARALEIASLNKKIKKLKKKQKSAKKKGQSSKAKSFAEKIKKLKKKLKSL